MASAIGMAAEKDAAASPFAHQSDRTAQALLVAFGVAARRAVRTQLAKRQVAAEDCNTRFGERLRQRHEQRGIAIRSGAMRQNEGVARGLRGCVQISSDRNFPGRLIFERLNRRVAHFSPAPNFSIGRGSLLVVRCGVPLRRFR